MCHLYLFIYSKKKIDRFRVILWFLAIRHERHHTEGQVRVRVSSTVWWPKIAYNKTLTMSETWRDHLTVWLLLWPKSAHRPMMLTMFYSWALTSIHLCNRLQFNLGFHDAICRQQTACCNQVYQICAVQRGLLWTYRIVKISQCVAGLMRITMRTTVKVYFWSKNK